MDINFFKSVINGFVVTAWLISDRYYNLIADEFYVCGICISAACL